MKEIKPKNDLGIEKYTTDETIRAVKDVLEAQALLKIIKPISDEIFKKAIDLYKPTIENREYSRKSIRHSVGKRIIEPRHLFLTDEKTFSMIVQYHKAGLADKGYKEVAPDF